MNRAVHVRVSGSDQDRSTAVTRVAAPVGQAVLPWTGTDGDPSIRRPHGCPPTSARQGADSKRGRCSQRIIRHS
ncbi:hypothetical protein FF096_21100 [Micromonospora sp. CP22]|nr:hypothetical protein [Micromonospora sp. CP22]